MNINLTVLGKLKEKAQVQLCQEYIKRIRPYANVNIVELKDISEPKNAKTADIKKIIHQEGELILPHIKSSDFVIALCIEGKQLNSEDFSDIVLQIRNSSKDIHFVIGGSNGLSENVKMRADLKLSFSKLTFPHGLMRVILLEQIYRCFQIISGSKYHK